MLCDLHCAMTPVSFAVMWSGKGPIIYRREAVPVKNTLIDSTQPNEYSLGESTQRLFDTFLIDLVLKTL